MTVTDNHVRSYTIANALSCHEWGGMTLREMQEEAVTCIKEDQDMFCCNKHVSHCAKALQHFSGPAVLSILAVATKANKCILYQNLNCNIILSSPIRLFLNEALLKTADVNNCFTRALPGKYTIVHVSICSPSQWKQQILQEKIAHEYAVDPRPFSPLRWNAWKQG